MEDTILNVWQAVKIYSQCASAICCLAVIISECESKLNGPCKEESVKWTESVQRMYFLGSGLRFGPNSILAP